MLGRHATRRELHPGAAHIGARAHSMYPLDVFDLGFELARFGNELQYVAGTVVQRAGQGHELLVVGQAARYLAPVPITVSE